MVAVVHAGLAMFDTATLHNLTVSCQLFFSFFHESQSRKFTVYFSPANSIHFENYFYYLSLSYVMVCSSCYSYFVLRKGFSPILRLTSWNSNMLPVDVTFVIYARAADLFVYGHSLTHSYIQWSVENHQLPRN